MLHDTFLGGVLRGCLVASAVPGIDVLETGGSASGREDRRWLCGGAFAGLPLRPFWFWGGGLAK